MKRSKNTYDVYVIRNNDLAGYGNRKGKYA